MKSFPVLLALSVSVAMCFPAVARQPADPYGSASVLPQTGNRYFSTPYGEEGSSQTPSWRESHRRTSSFASDVFPASTRRAPPAEIPAEDAEPEHPYLEAMSEPWDEACSDCGEPSCPRQGCSPWFGGVYGLVMTRENEDAVWFSYFDSNESIQRTDSREAGMGWGGGYGVYFGRQIACTPYAWEVVYWGLFSDVQEANLYASDFPGALNTTLDFSRLNYDNGVDAITDVNSWYDNAQRHRLRRSFEFHNVELNLLHRPLYGYQQEAGGHPLLEVDWAIGVRYLKIDEGLQFATNQSSTVFGTSPEDEAFYDIEVENHLIGLQLGCHAETSYWLPLSVYADTKFGLYGNHIRHHSFIGGHNGAAFVGAGPNAGRVFDIRSTANDVSFVGEVRLGGTYEFFSGCQLNVGYQAMAITGVAYATEQIPPIFAGIDDVIDIDVGGGMILHGAYAGIECRW